jgi:DNA-binding CsgD family transcriptional regulator
MSLIRSLSDRINSAKGNGEIWDAALAILPSLELSKVVFLDLSKRNTPLILSNAGQKWDHEYTQSVVSGADPFAANCLSRINSMLTGIEHLESHPYLDAHAKGLVAAGSEMLGIRTGMSITVNPHKAGSGIGWNLMTGHSVTEFSQLRKHYETEWRAWCQLTFAGFSIANQHEGSSLLTSREYDCLAHIADGLRTADIAHCLGIAETTVEMHLRNARSRLGAKTRDQAVAIAIRQGLI